MSEIFNCENGSPCSCCHALKRTTRDVGYLDRENKRLQDIIDSQLVTTGTQETIANLRAQLAAAQGRVDTLNRRENEFYKPYVKELIIERDAARQQIAQRDAEIAELRKDRERWQHTKKHISVLRDDWSVLHWRIDEPRPDEEYLNTSDAIVSAEFEREVDAAIAAAEGEG